MTEPEVRERLLEAAGPVFAEKGLHHATVREICKAANVNLASVNYYFGDKQQLYVETVRQARLERARQFPFPQWDAATPPETRLYGFIRTILHRLLEPSSPWQPRLMMREVLEPTDACRDLVDDYFRPHFEQLLSIIRQLVGEDIAPHVSRQYAFSVFGQCLLYRVAGPIVKIVTPAAEYEQYFTIPQLATHITRFTLAACGQPVTASPSVWDAENASPVDSSV